MLYSNNKGGIWINIKFMFYLFRTKLKLGGKKTKKLLAFLWSFSIIGVSVISATACATKQRDSSLETIKKELEQYVKVPFLASSSIITNEQLAEELGNRLTLANYKLVIKNDETFVKPKIAGGNEQYNTLAISKQQESKGDLKIVNGTAIVSVLRKDKEELNIKIKWVVNELLHLKNAVNKINSTSDIKPKIDLPFPQIKAGINLTFADLYNFISILPLPTEEIMKIDLTKIMESDFISKFDNVLEIIDNSAKNIGVNINSYLNKDISFDETIKGKGTVRDLLHNAAPDLIALLQWFVKDGKTKIKKTNNTILPLVQYLLSPINPYLKANINAAFGENYYFYQNSETNLDSLVFYLLVGYKAEYEKNESKYRISVPFFGEIGQRTVGTFFGLKTSLLVGSILDIFVSEKDKQGIDAVNTNLMQPSTWKGIKSHLTWFIPKINFFLGPSLMTYAGFNILRDLGVSNTGLKSNDVTMNSGRVTLQFKNKTGNWEDFTAIVGENDKLNLNQILNAVDFKLSFTDVKFKVTAKVNDKITYETNGKSFFDICKL
ncbi:hypothetical protein [Spiroplasma endosymbiont of Polydrusus formosus]|uniref:hypothetical protein n=1 Tax=Spiroplasma endosymbiont of Polydrusus formosus TaxID=3139326 RepID=UPI0035B56DA1